MTKKMKQGILGEIELGSASIQESTEAILGELYKTITPDIGLEKIIEWHKKMSSLRGEEYQKLKYSPQMEAYDIISHLYNNNIIFNKINNFGNVYPFELYAREHAEKLQEYIFEELKALHCLDRIL